MSADSDKNWNPNSWRKFPIQQQPTYENPTALSQVLHTISHYPPLVFSGEIDQLKLQLADASVGKRFLLQGGDCAERFQDCTPESITSKLKILLQMSVILCYASRRPVIRIGRIAGQYAKPRTQDTEVVGGETMPVFRGDNINSFEADKEQRQPNPARLLQSYHTASMTLNYIRAMITGGFADLHYPENWNLRFVKNSRQREQYEAIVANIRDAVAFMTSFGGVVEDRLGSVDFFTSHEGLLLGFEEAMTRYTGGEYYDLSAHMLWIGERTRDLKSAHVEFFRGIANPVGVKLGPTVSPRDTVELLTALNPRREPGKIVAITRMGHDKVKSSLPAVVEAVKASGIPVVWSCDPMHGNVVKTANNVKTRDFDAILSELEQTFATHRQCGTMLGGVHFELTGEDVTECIGGSEGIEEEDLSRQYETFCDPRLNYSQSLEMAFLISSFLQTDRPAFAFEKIQASKNRDRII